MEITLNVTAEEARRIVRALERSRIYWRGTEMIERYEGAVRISHKYRDLARDVREKIKEQEAEP